LPGRGHELPPARLALAEACVATVKSEFADRPCCRTVTLSLLTAAPEDIAANVVRLFVAGTESAGVAAKERPAGRGGAMHVRA
jgi:hypothetical protein